MPVSNCEWMAGVAALAARRLVGVWMFQRWFPLDGRWIGVTCSAACAMHCNVLQGTKVVLWLRLHVF